MINENKLTDEIAINIEDLNSSLIKFDKNLVENIYSLKKTSLKLLEFYDLNLSKPDDFKLEIQNKKIDKIDDFIEKYKIKECKIVLKRIDFECSRNDENKDKKHVNPDIIKIDSDASVGHQMKVDDFEIENENKKIKQDNSFVSSLMTTTEPSKTPVRVEDKEELNFSNYDDCDRKKRKSLVAHDDYELLNKELKNALEQEIRELKRTLHNQLGKTNDNNDNGTLYLDDARLLKVSRLIASKLTEYQIKNIKFMFEKCYESGEMGGCIITNCIDSERTFQAIAFIKTVVVHNKLTKTNHVIILTRDNLLVKWRQECIKWLKDINTFDITPITVSSERLRLLEDWQRHGGIMLISYRVFKYLILNEMEKIEKYLINPGADLILCDEFHLAKSSKTVISQLVNRINTKRRIVMTSSKLESNRNVFDCMISFIKPNLFENLRIKIAYEELLNYKNSYLFDYV